jgi:hypothetical protein
MQYAVVKEQGVTFTIVVVKDYVIRSTFEAQRTQAAFEREFGTPVALWGASSQTVYGRPDIVRFLQNIHVSQIPWRRRAA